MRTLLGARLSHLRTDIESASTDNPRVPFDREGDMKSWRVLMFGAIAYGLLLATSQFALSKDDGQSEQQSDDQNPAHARCFPPAASTYRRQSRFAPKITVNGKRIEAAVRRRGAAVS